MFRKILICFMFVLSVLSALNNSYAQTPTPTLTPEQLNNVPGCITGKVSVNKPKAHDDNPKVFSVYGSISCNPIIVNGKSYPSFRYFKVVLLAAGCPDTGCFVAGPPPECNVTSLVCATDPKFKSNPFVLDHKSVGKLFDLDLSQYAPGTYKFKTVPVGTSGGIPVGQNNKDTFTITVK